MTRVSLVGPDGARLVEADPVDEHKDILVHIATDRSVIVGVNTEPEPGEEPYVAFWTIPDREEYQDEWDKRLGHASNPLERYMAMIFHPDKYDPEPEFPCKVINLDGISVVRVNLDKRMQDYTLYIPEAYFQ